MGCFDTVRFENNPRILRRLGKVFLGGSGDFDYCFQTKSLNCNFDNYVVNEFGIFSAKGLDCSKFTGKFVVYNFITDNVWLDVLLTINNGRFVDLAISDLRIKSHSMFHSNQQEELSGIINIKRKR